MSQLTPLLGRALRAASLLVIATSPACSRTISVATTTIDAAPIPGFKTFSVMAPPPPAEHVLVGSDRDDGRATAILMDMDPMLATSIVGRAMRQNMYAAFEKRGYRSADWNPDFYVAYYAGVGQVVDAHASLTKYRRQGEKLTTETVEYPAGTIVVDVIDAPTNFLVWRGTAVSEIPNDPNDYADAIRATVYKIVRSFPKARH